MADQLCTSGLAGKVYTLNVRSDSGSSGIQYPGHRVSDGDPVLGIDGHAHHVWHGLRNCVLELLRQLLRIDNMRPVESPAHGYSANCARQLDRTHRHRALSDAHRDDLARV